MRNLLGKPISTSILQDTSSILLKIIEAKKKKKQKKSKSVTGQTLGRRDDITMWYLDWAQENKEKLKRKS